MTDDSFDPRSWNKGEQKTARLAEVSAKEKEGRVESESPNAASGDLPEAWRVVRLETSAEQFPALRGSDFGRRYGLIAASALLLIGGAAAAWTTRIHLESKENTPMAQAAPVPGMVERRVVLAGVGDILGALTAAGIDPAQARAAADAAAKVIAAPGEIHALFQVMPQGQGFVLQHLQASSADGSGVVVDRNETGQFTATRVMAELTKQIRVLRGELDSTSFYSSAVAAGLVDTLIPEFINAFSYDFNLASEVSPGDTFEVAYVQSVDAAGNAVGQPELLFASLTTKAKSLALYRFQMAGGEVGWFDGNGASTKRGLMRTPVDGARITSNFGMRFHPVLHYTRLHAGVDFGVPVGTPVYAAAAGVVTGATPTDCGGNMAVVQHDNGWVTRYFHLSQYAAGLHEGQRVPQGYTLGLSGTTGSCTTGPHLHFELRVDGEPVDPLSVKTDDSERKRLEGAGLQAFMAQRNRVDVARAQQAG